MMLQVAYGLSLLGCAMTASIPGTYHLLAERVQTELFDLIDNYHGNSQGYIDFQPMDTVPAHVLQREAATNGNMNPAAKAQQAMKPSSGGKAGGNKQSTSGAPPSVDKTKLLFNIDGTTQYYTGINAWWMSAIADSKKTDQYMSDIANSGLKILRVWGFYDLGAAGDPKGPDSTWFQDLSSGDPSKVKINTGSDGLQRLDQVCKSAESHGVKLIIPLVNSLPDLGGIPAYMRAFKEDRKTWFSPSSKSQKAYMNYVKTVVSRYKTRLCIFAWELSNEVRCQVGCDKDNKNCKPCDDGTIVYNWASATAKMIKQIDSSHMVTLGDEGFAPKACPQGVSSSECWPYMTSQGVSFAKNIAIPEIDFGTYHMYPADDWQFSEYKDWSTKWIQAHADVCASASKPCLLEEYGTQTDRVGRLTPWQQKASSTKGNAGDMIWQLGESGSQRDAKTVDFGSSEFASLVKNHASAGGSKSQTAAAGGQQIGSTKSGSQQAVAGKSGGQ